MRLSTVVAVLVPVAAVSAQQTFTVIVGGNNALTFEPTTVNAVVGDTIAFQFQSKNHTVTQSTFTSPCETMTTPVAGIDSGYMPVAAGATSFPQWSFTMTNDSVPLWFYCRQTGHCKQGMVFAINPTEDKTFAEFQAAAESGGSPTASGSATGTTSTTSASAQATNSAMRYSSSAATVLAVVGLAAGILL